MEYYSDIKKKKILPFVTVWMDKENIMLSEISQSEKDNYCGGAPPTGHPQPPRMRISLPRHELLGEERWLISQRRRAKSLFLNGLLLGSIFTEIQVKLINHCQAVRINNT